MLFDSWFGVLRVLIVGTAAYAGLLLLLRASGKRTLTKLNAFDLVVTVALGSTLSSIILSKDVALLEGVSALGLLIFLQFVISWASVRSRRIEGLVKSEPALLLRHGRLLDAPLKRERITRNEVMAALRSEGVADAGEVEAVILETDGSLSVIKAPFGNASEPTVNHRQID